MDIYTVIGALAVITISIGLLLKKRVRQDILYVIGGILLTMYSIHVKDTLFIILQVIFIISALGDVIKTERELKKKR